MKSFVLSTKGFSEKHTGVNVCEALKNVVREFGISEAQVVAVVHDQGSNNEVTADLLHENIGWYDVKCAGHCLQLCINSGFSIPAIDRMLSVSRKIVSHFHHSVRATEALRKRQKQMDVPVRKLKQYVATRWNSNLFMLESLLNSHWPIAAVLSDTEVTEAKYRYLDLKLEQWELLEKLVPVLQPLQTATTFLCYEYNVSCSCVLPVLFGILQALQVSEDNLSSISHFKIDVSSEIRRWSLDSLDPSSPLVIASALDPRFKHIKYAPDDSFRESVKREILSQMERYSNSDTPLEPPSPKHQKETALDILLGPEDTERQSSTLTDELSGYFSCKAVLRETNPLDWWQINQYNYPNLAHVVKRYYSIPATSTPSERIFSKAGFIVNQYRSALKPDKVNELIFLSKNLLEL